MSKKGKKSDAEEDFDDMEAMTVPPDGGRGWVIVFAVFIGNCLMDGCIGSFGIFYPELLRAFDAGPVVTSLAGSLLPAVYMMPSPVVGSLYTSYGSRSVCFVGGCIGAVGLILASVSTNIAMFHFTFGVVVGLITQYSQNYALSMGFAAILFMLASVIQSLVLFLNMCSKQTQKTEFYTNPEIDVK